MNWAPIIDRFRHCRVLVVGDICLDRWCLYDPSAGEPSRETGIARVGVIDTTVTPGAGGTVASNLAALGAGHVSVLGAIGQDGFGFELKDGLAKREIDHHLLVISKCIQTFTYTKVINHKSNNEDRPRLDFINSSPLSEEVENQLIENFRSSYEDFDVVMVADQAETDQGGVITYSFRDVLTDAANSNPEKIMIADSRNRIERFRNVIAKPNIVEATNASARLCGTLDLPRLRDTIGIKPLVVTRGPEGVLLADDNGVREIPTVSVDEPVDICGAGDSFAAGMALVLGSGIEIETAIYFGSLVSSITIMKKGTGVAAPKEVLAKSGVTANWN